DSDGPQSRLVSGPRLRTALRGSRLCRPRASRALFRTDAMSISGARDRVVAEQRCSRPGPPNAPASRREQETAMPERRGSTIIENVQPQVDGGRYPVKRKAGDPVRITDRKSTRLNSSH